jgi:hypothetical protein
VIGNSKFGFPLIQINGCDGCALVRALQFGKNNFGLRGQARGAAVFKLNFGPTVGAGENAVALRDGHVNGGAFVAVTVIEINLAFHVADAHNARIRLTQGGGGQHG